MQGGVSTKADIEEVIAAVELATCDLTIKLKAIIAAGIAIVATLVKLTH